ncbi:MAG: EAL domain-containing protein [Treponemataceae bacterium]|nr:EAL domain-containing protein [Treponemataceae bacterium]
MSKEQIVADQIQSIQEKISKIDQISSGECTHITAPLRKDIGELVETLSLTDQRFDINNFTSVYKIINRILAQNERCLYGTICGNVKQMQMVNQSIGFPQGTIVLEKLFTGIKPLLDEDEIIATPGGDNFLIICKTEHIELLLNYFEDKKVFYEKERSVTLESVLTVNQNLERYKTFVEIMNSLMPMLNYAKEISKAQRFVLTQNRKNFVLYIDEKVGEAVKRSQEIESIFSIALLNKEFMVYYQPKVNLRNYTLIGAEALCRWKHEGQMIFPDQFIPVLEKNNSIADLDFYMIENVCADIRQWLDEGRQMVQISINLSRCSMTQPNLAERIIAIIDKYNVPHKYIQIELTETSSDVKFSDLQKLATALRNANISIAIDDFGIGYSSLSLIRYLPWNMVKIDKSLLHENENPDEDQHLVFKSVAAMVQTLGIECIVEGVETVADIQLLKESNCYLAQGYYFDRPLPKNDFYKRLNAQ